MSVHTALVYAYRSACFSLLTDTATTEIYTLSLHDALPISAMFDAIANHKVTHLCGAPIVMATLLNAPDNEKKPLPHVVERSEEHTSELQSHSDLVCRLLLEKKKSRTTAASSTFLLPTITEC